MRSTPFQSEAQQIDWAYEARKPWRILFRLLNKGVWFYLAAACVFTIKHSPLWLMGILPAEVINALASPENADRDRMVFLATATVLLLAFNIPFHMLFSSNVCVSRSPAGFNNFRFRSTEHLKVGGCSRRCCAMSSRCN
jgi:ATP-binding cassette subfamily B protein